MNIFIASKKDFFRKLIEENNEGNKYKIVGSCINKAEISGRIQSCSENVDILIITPDLDGRGQTEDIIIQLKRENPLLRILYISKQLELTNPYVVNTMCQMVDSRVYDIYHDTKMTKTVFFDLLDNPRSLADVSYFYDYKRMLETNNADVITEKTNKEEVVDDSRNNIIAVSSCKPGSGKSFVSSNLAVAIAHFGKMKVNREKPKVLLIDADLQTLSVGTLFGNINPQFGIKTALNKVSKIVDENGEIIGSNDSIGLANEFIKDCCVKSELADNLYVMTGTNLTIEELQRVTPYQFYYLLDVVSTMFDVVIIDTNSSLEHVTSGVSFQLSKHCLMVLNPDLNSININERKKKELDEIGVGDKVQYVINRHTNGRKSKEYEENIKSSFKVIARIPEIEENVFCNSIFNHCPVVLDKSIFSLSARVEFEKLANNFWLMDNIKELTEEVNKVKGVKANAKK